MSTSDLFAGVDVGAGRVHVALVRGSSVVEVRSGPPESVTGRCTGAARVAVDAPGGLSLGAHAGDVSVAPKFRGGRCSEVPVPGVPAVPWVTPGRLAEAPGWMQTGFAVWSALQAAGLEVVEAFPAAGFHRLNGRRWPARKSTPTGRAERLALLGRMVALPASASGWRHDDIDAVMCAVTAAYGGPSAHSCDRPDGSVMWLLDDVPGAGSEDGELVEDG
jgi:predicted nuclease with RNAse H fold